MLGTVWAQSDRVLRFEVQLSSNLKTPSSTGRLFVFLSRRDRGEPMMGPNWFSPEPFFAVDVKDFQPGQTRTIDASAEGYPKSLAELETGRYRVQALFDQDFYYPVPAAGPGNAYSLTKALDLDPNHSGAISIVLDKLVPEPEFKDTKWVKFVAQPSELLSEFHGREVIDRVAVVLPASYYTEPQRRYPVYYEVSGFGGSLAMMTAMYGREPERAAEGEAEFIHVMLTGECKWGHHVYANSATNGPRGDALVREMVPTIDREFRTVADPRARFVGGHSSGGWSSLWLQVIYPETFGGVWSTSPDPVDFRDWQGTNLYTDEPPSLFIDEKGDRRPLARQGTKPILWYDSFCKMDDVLGRGGQLRSFEAVFSPRGEDGEPVRCWDRSTGRVDPEVLEHWKKYDISLILEENWPELKDQLAGKIRVWNGGLDTFYLEGATKLLGERLQKLGSDAYVEIVPGKNHGSILTPQLRSQIKSQMTAEFLKHFNIDGTEK
jgi:S-formylglutathione hydrolase FrmB